MDKVQTPEEKSKFNIRRKISQLQNKAYFFQGQINPISSQNITLKQQLISLTRTVTASTELLRNLLPIEHDSNRKLKIQMASLQQISAMIKQDWLLMKQQISNLHSQINEKNTQILSIKQQHIKSREMYEKTIETMKFEYQQKIARLSETVKELQQQVIDIKEKAEKQRIKLIEQYRVRIEKADKLEKQFRRYVMEANEKCANYERAVQRLKDQINSNLSEFEKSKQNLKEIYERIMEQKLNEQKQSYEFLLKMREEQKLKLVEEINEEMRGLRQKIERKDWELEHMLRANEKMKEQIQGFKDEIWEGKLKMDKMKIQIKQLENSIFKQKQNSRCLSKRIEDEELLRVEREKFHQDQLMKQKKAFDLQLSKTSLFAERLLSQKQSLLLKLSQNEKQLEKVNKQLKQNHEKYQELLQEERTKYSEMLEQNRKLQDTLEESNLRFKQKAEEMEQMKKEHLKSVQKMRQFHEQQRRNMEIENERRMNDVISKHEQSMSKMMREYDRKITQLQVDNNEYIRKLITQQNMKQYEHQQKLKLLVSQSEQKLKALDKLLKQRQQENEKLQNKCSEYSRQIQRERMEAKERLESKLRQQQKQYENEREEILKNMKQQISVFYKALQQKQAEYEKSLSEIKKQMQEQINLLKQTNCVEEMEDRFNGIIAQLKQNLIDERNRLEQQRREEMKRMKEQHNFLLNKLTEEYHNELTMISKKLQFDLSQLNEELLEEKDAHEFTKLSREEKIVYLMNKITEYKEDMMEKQNRIVDLELLIKRKDKELERIQEIVCERVKERQRYFEKEVMEIRGQCERMMKDCRVQCKIEIKKIETQRIMFTEQLYREFQEIKNRHQVQMRGVIKKYEELQKLFEERPSRAEDLTKIQELIHEREKMDLQIMECKKKVKQANEIVKYLNLSLENYKDTYNIFGPNGQELYTIDNKRVGTEVSCESPTKSLINTNKVLVNNKSYNESERKVMTESDVTQFKMFPLIHRNSFAVQQLEEEDREEVEERPNFNNERKNKRKNKSNIHTIQDKSEELREHASLFMNLISHDEKPVVEINRKNSRYKRRVSLAQRARRQKSIQGVGQERTVTIKQKQYALNF